MELLRFRQVTKSRIRCAQTPSSERLCQTSPGLDEQARCEHLGQALQEEGEGEAAERPWPTEAFTQIAVRTGLCRMPRAWRVYVDSTKPANRQSFFW